MNKKTKQKEVEMEIQQPLDPDRMYSREDANEMERLFKVAVATPHDMEVIYRLFKKYIKPGARPYTVNCRCATSISKYYQGLLDWFASNRNLFESA